MTTAVAISDFQEAAKTVGKRVLFDMIFAKISMKIKIGLDLT